MQKNVLERYMSSKLSSIFSILVIAAVMFFQLENAAAQSESLLGKKLYLHSHKLNLGLNPFTKTPEEIMASGLVSLSPSLVSKMLTARAESYPELRMLQNTKAEYERLKSKESITQASIDKIRQAYADYIAAEEKYQTLTSKWDIQLLYRPFKISNSFNKLTVNKIEFAPESINIYPEVITSSDKIKISLFENPKNNLKPLMLFEFDTQNSNYNAETILTQADCQVRMEYDTFDKNGKFKIPFTGDKLLLCYLPNDMGWIRFYLAEGVK